MIREPSIHITKSKLTGIIEKLVMPMLPESHIFEIGDLVDEILYLAKEYSINTRTITISNDKMEKKAKALLSASRMDADTLAQLIYTIRKKMKHRGISRIQPGSKDWGMLKGITQDALGFCNEFGLTRRYGFLRYIEIGLSMMQKFMINKFKNLYQGICERHQAIVEIEKDNDKEMTNSMYKFYTQHIIENTGMMDRLDEIPEKYVWFVRGREEAEKMNISVKVYIKAQFKGLDFSKGIPHPIQLVGPKAIDRVIRYCYKEGIKVS